MARRVHVIGAGLAGLAAAVHLQRRGAQVVLHEATAQAGGRCRSYYDETLGATIDNGNHLVFSGSHATLGYVRAIGAGGDLVGPAQPAFPFLNMATRARWTVRPSTGLVPWWIFDQAARAPNTQPGDYLALLPLLLARPGRTMAQTMRCDGPLWDRLLRPLFLARLNIEPRQATAQLAGTLVREALASGGDACRTLFARNGVGSAFIDPALRLLQHGGAAIRLGSPLKAIGFGEPARLTTLIFGEDTVELAEGDAVVLAVPPDVAPTLVPGLQAPNRFSATISAHFAIEPPFGLPPLTGLINSTAEWLFARDSHLSVTISGADRLLDTPHEMLAKTLWAEVVQAAGLTGTPMSAAPLSTAPTPAAPIPTAPIPAVPVPAVPMPAAQIVVEKRATFAALPDQEMRRPGTRTRWNNLTLAGDWTATGLPATIEGAIRSGQKAADALLNITMERR